MKLSYDEPVSNFAFNFNLRRYIVCGGMFAYNEMSKFHPSGNRTVAPPDTTVTAADVQRAYARPRAERELLRLACHYGGVVFETRLAMFGLMRELSRDESKELTWEHVADDGTHPGGSRSAEVYGGFLVDAVREGLRAAGAKERRGEAGEGVGAGLRAAGAKRGAGAGAGAGLQAAGAQRGAAPNLTEPEPAPPPSTTEPWMVPPLYNAGRETVSDTCFEFAKPFVAEPRSRFGIQVGQCRMTVSQPVLNAPMVSALETIIW